MKNIPTIKSKWTDVTGSEFQVIKTESVENKLWIHYTKLGTDSMYNCLVDAFLSRFKEQLA